MDQASLNKLREQILSDIVPLALDSAEPGADKFALLLRVIQAGNAGGDVYKRAYESARQIEDKSQQLDALLALVDEIDFDLSNKAPKTQPAPVSVPASTEPAPVPEIPTSQPAPQEPPVQQ